MDHPAKASATQFSRYCGSSKDQSVVPSLKSSIALSMMRQQQQQQRSPAPPLPALPPAAFSNDGDHFSTSSDDISTFPRDDDHLQRNDDDSCSIVSTYTYHHQQEKSETDFDFAKMMTLQSIDRLETHLPRIVVNHIIADMTRQKIELAEDNTNNKHCPLGGSLTLEVPMGLAIGSSSNGNSNTSDGAGRARNETKYSSGATTEATKVATISSVQSVPPAGLSQLLQKQTDNDVCGMAKQQQQFQKQQQPRRASGKSTTSTGGVSDLLCTLTSLDELLEEEFSSSSEDDDSADDDGDNSSSNDGDDDSDSSDYEVNSEDSEEEDEDSAMCASALIFEDYDNHNDDDDGVSDIGDDGISDMGDSYHLNDVDALDDPLFQDDIRTRSEPKSGSRWRQNPRRSRSIDSAHGSVTSGLSGDSDKRSRNGTSSSGGQVGRTASGELEVGKLRQGRLNNRRLESDTLSDDRSLSVDVTTLSTKSDGGVIQSLSTGVQATQHQSAILFVDISGFTKLSQSLEVETLSEIINNYFQMIVDEIKDCGGDILKFAGDALIIEWTQEMLPEGQKHINVTLLAAHCGSQLVGKCSDFRVDRDGQLFTLNLHCALGFGDVVGAHCGDMDRMEYLILGDSVKQIAAAMEIAKLGEVVASPEAMSMLGNNVVSLTNPYREGEHYTVAFKNNQKFQAKRAFQIPKSTRTPVSEQCKNWSAQELEDLQRRMSRYVHGVVYVDEFCREEAMVDLSQRRSNFSRNSNTKSKQTQSELRDVFTVFIQPKFTDDLNGDASGDDETLDLLNSIMFIVNTEVTHHKAHLRQFIVDDKGLVVIANFGLRGSTFPNMIEERAIPCITNIRTLLKTELGLECSIGATYGKAYCGVVGGRKRHEYAILGPSVNLAARLMANNCNPGILVDEKVKQMSGDRPFQALPPVKAKGYDDLVKIYSPEESARKTWKDVSDEFVGRQKETETLVQIAESVEQDAFASKFVLVSGAYGIGKSYVLSHATQEIENSCKAKSTPTHVSRLVFCDDDSFRPFSIVRPLFMALLSRKQHVPSFGAADKAGHTENIDQKAEVEEAQLYVSLLQICLEAKIPMQYIEMFGGLIFSTKLSDIGTWSDRSARMSEWNSIATHLVTAFIHCTAEYGLVLLSLDNISGCDEMSWKILSKLYQRASNLLVVGTARNEFDLNINAEFWSDLNEEGIDSGRFKHLRMQPMILGDVSKLACKRLGKNSADLDDSLCKTLSAQSRGNPLLACEILDVMYTEIDASEPAVSGAALSKIEELLLNRLDELSPVDRAHLNLGAILGFTFKEKDIICVMERYNNVKEDDKESHARIVRASLQESVDYGILKCTEAPLTTTYKFSNALWMRTIALHILDSWKDEMRALIDVVTGDGNICVKYDWDELASIRENLFSMRQQNAGIQESINELRSLIQRAR